MTEKTSLKQSRNPFLTIGRYVRQVIDETRKTVTPTAREWLAWSIAAFVFVILLMILVTGMDFGLGKLTLMVFGCRSHIPRPLPCCYGWVSPCSRFFS